jgi:ABC-type antimicrobial peptide transport system permease subunit
MGSILAITGIFGLAACSVSRRLREIGIRMALGANRNNVLRMVLRSAFLQVGIGLLIGIAAMVLVGRAMASQLFGVKAYDPVVLSVTVLVLGAAACVAALIPARRAAGVEPMRALRSE